MDCLGIHTDEGFTLIELMIVIAIIGILAAIAIPQFSSYRQRAFNSAAMSDLKNAATAQEAYYADKKRYAASAVSLVEGYGIAVSENVSLATDGGIASYTVIAYHTSGSKTFTINGPGGKIE